MTLLSLSPAAMKLAALALVAVGTGLAGYGLAQPESFVKRHLARYLAYLNGLFRSMFMPEDGAKVALKQATTLLSVVVGKIALDVPMSPLWIAIILIGPSFRLVRKRNRRLLMLEDQADGFITALANSLKTVPSPGAALHATTSILQQPMRQEIEKVVAEMRVGSTLEQGLLAMSARLRSKPLDTAFSAILIGMRVGGNLPATLERTAATIRELNRLHGVVRTKTGEGRMQLWVLACFPFGAVLLFSAASPGYFDPLKTSIYGQIAVSVAAVLWLSALLIARKILAVDL